MKSSEDLYILYTATHNKNRNIFLTTTIEKFSYYEVFINKWYNYKNIEITTKIHVPLINNYKE